MTPELRATETGEGIATDVGENEDHVRPNGARLSRVECIVGPEVERIGLVFSSVAPDNAVVKRIVPGTWADQKGIMAGDHVESVNGISIQEMSKASFSEAMSTRPVSLLVRHPLPDERVAQCSVERAIVFAAGAEAEAQPSCRRTPHTAEVTATDVSDFNGNSASPSDVEAISADCILGPDEDCGWGNFQFEDDGTGVDHIKRDYYEQFSLERYTEVSGIKAKYVIRMYRELSRRWHPDKNPASNAALCDAMQKHLNHAKTVLLDPDLKQQYDHELRAQRAGDRKVFWYGSWGFVAMAGAGAVTAIVAGIPILAAALFGCSAGVGFKVTLDPGCSAPDLVREALGGCVAGVAAGCVGVSFLTTTFGQAALVGAAATLSGTTAKDTFDLAVANGALGESLKGSGSSVRGNADIFSVENVKTKVCQCTVGALVGGVIPVHTGSTDQFEQSARVVARMSVGAAVLYMPSAIAAIGENRSEILTTWPQQDEGVAK